MKSRIGRWVARALLALVLLAAGLSAIGAAWQASTTSGEMTRTPAPGQLVDVGGYRLHVWCIGTGPRTVVLESGLGGTAFDWGYVQPRLAMFTRVCSYDRAGLGYSDRGLSPRTGHQISSELRRALNGAGVRSGLVLVGASFGGLIARLFAAEHPRDVEAIVLVDASHEDQGPRLAAAGAPDSVPPFARLIPYAAALGVTRMAGISPMLPEQALAPDVRRYASATHFRASAFASTVDEYMSLPTTLDQVRRTRKPLLVPVVVISRSPTRQVANPSAETVWQELQASHLTLSAQSCRIVASRSGHLIERDEPDVIVNAMQNLFQSLDSRARLDCARAMR